MNSQTNVHDHVGELLSGYIDGELTQQQRQLVEVHCNQCAHCKEELSSIRAMRSAVGGSSLSSLGEDQWRERSTDASVRALSHLGWFIAIVSLCALGAGALYFFLLDATIAPWQKFGIGGVYAGSAVLLLSVIRQRWLESKTDKYNDVEI